MYQTLKKIKVLIFVVVVVVNIRELGSNVFYCAVQFCYDKLYL